MFSISNIIAYERLMVSAKSQNKSMIRECLGPSTWFHILGGSLDKWCPEEGKKVLKLLTKLKENLVPPNLYIVTPFKIVANNLRKIIIESNVLKSWVHDSYLWTLEHVGTVHTLQGREAEAVILVLGAQDVSQGGARNWAGQFPNMLNVAVTRAKEVIYVVGNKSLWSEVGVFKELHDRINIAS
jgi:superfamily I DNA and/or RNA helicase